MASGKFFRRPAVLLALALCSVGGLVTLMGHLATGPQVTQKRVQLSNGEESEAYPSISPDGKRIAYSARESSKVSAFHVFVRELPSGKPQQLTKGEGSDIAPVWSPDGGTLAFLRVEDENTQCIVIPADGGTERKLADLGPAADSGQPLPAVSWNADGKSLVVVQSGEKQAPGLAILTVDSGKLQRITNPAEGSEGDSTPAVSPTGTSIAFVRHTQNEGADIFLCDATGGGLRRLTFDDRGIRGIAWTRDGQDLLYSGHRVGGWRLWRVPAYGGSPRDLVISGKQAYYPAIGRNRLAYTDSPTVSAIWRATLSTADVVEERPLIRSTGREVNAVWSPDGTKIADVSDQSGSDEIFVNDADGRNRVQVTQLKGPRVGRLRWSPDAKTIIFDASSDHGQEVFTVSGRAREQTGARPAQRLQRVLFTRWQVDLLPVARPDLEGHGGRRQSASHRRAARRRPAHRIGRRQVRLLPFAPRHLAHSHRRRRRRRGLRSGARYVGPHQHAAHEKGHLLHRIRAQRAHPGSFLLRLRHEEELHRLPHAKRRLGQRRRVLRLPRRQEHSLRAGRSESNQSDAGGKLPLDG